MGKIEALVRLPQQLAALGAQGRGWYRTRTFRAGFSGGQPAHAQLRSVLSPPKLPPPRTVPSFVREGGPHHHRCHGTTWTSVTHLHEVLRSPLTLRITCGSSRRGPCVVCKARDGTDRAGSCACYAAPSVRNLQYRDMWPWTYDPGLQNGVTRYSPAQRMARTREMARRARRTLLIMRCRGLLHWQMTLEYRNDDRNCEQDSR